jgi:hypothetical protein
MSRRLALRRFSTILDGTFELCPQGLFIRLSTSHADKYRAFNTSFVSNDKWFEVDGAQATRDFIRHIGGRKWDEHRLQLIWDAVALHTNPNIAKFKEPEVMFTSAGTFSELVGPELAKQQFVNHPFFSFRAATPKTALNRIRAIQSLSIKQSGKTSWQHFQEHTSKPTLPKP